ncbi:MAG: hypothetical protein E7605_04525 [Ruminococcaceae bacterium]|nr:hypothetical protein [Oscillospiraceae bacterium]
MKKRTIVRLAAALLIILSLLCLPGCQSRSPTRYFSYLDSPMHATLTGKINGIPFAATLYSEGREAGGARGMPDAALTFTAPDTLAGVSVRFRAETGEWSLSLDDLAGEIDAAGLGAIASMLLCEQAITSSTRRQSTVTLTLADGTVLTLDEATGKPLGATRSTDGRVIEITVVRWE